MDLEEPEVAFSFEKAVWTLWTLIPLCIFCCEVYDKIDHIGVRGQMLIVCLSSTQWGFWSRVCFLRRKPFMYGNFWSIIEGSVEVLNEVQSILVH